MSWFKKKRSLGISPILLADLLYQNWVEEDNPQAAPEQYQLPEAVHERFRQKVFLYREANVLSALLIWAKQDLLFEQPLQEYERILFPQSPRTPAGAARLQAVKAAMGDLQDLIRLNEQRSGEFTWARKWFADIGHDETNPETLVQLSLLWLRHYGGAQGLLKELSGSGADQARSSASTDTSDFSGMAEALEHIVERNRQQTKGDAQRLVGIIKVVADRIGEAPVAYDSDGKVYP